MQNGYLQPQTIARMQAEEFAYVREFTIGEGTSATPGTDGSGSIPIQSSGPFFMERLTISFPTVTKDEEDVDVDDAVDRLSVLVKNSSNNIPLFSDFCPLHLFAVPGRRATPGVTSPFAPGTLRTDGFPLRAFFPTSGNIGFDFRNRALVPATVAVACWGWLIPKEIVPDSVTFRKIVRECQQSAPWVEG